MLCTGSPVQVGETVQALQSYCVSAAVLPCPSLVSLPCQFGGSSPFLWAAFLPWLSAVWAPLAATSCLLPSWLSGCLGVVLSEG